VIKSETKFPTFKDEKLRIIDSSRLPGIHVDKNLPGPGSYESAVDNHRTLGRFHKLNKNEFDLRKMDRYFE